MRSFRKSGITALTAGIALSIGAVPVMLTVPAIVGSSAPTTLTPGSWVSAGHLELTTTPANTATVKLIDSSDVETTAQNLSATNCVPLVSSGADLLSFAGEGAVKGKQVGPAPVGLLKGSFGVQDRGTGTSCGQVDSAASESLTLALGDDAVGVLGLPVLASSALLDLDLKGGANIIATATGPGGVVFERELQSGSSIVILDPDDPNYDPTVTQCNAKSDSGADSGANDNCDWLIEDEGTHFNSLTLKAVSGSFALSGGADYVSKANPSRIELVEDVDGSLACYQTISPSTPAVGVEVTMTRLVDAGDSPECAKIPYRFTNDVDSAEFLKPFNQSTKAQFNFDFRWTVPADEITDSTETSGLVKRTSVDFDGESRTADLPSYISLCPAVEESVDDDGNLLGYVLSATDLDAAEDLAPGYGVVGTVDTKQFACVVSQSIDPILGTDDVEVHEVIYAYGDILMRK